MKKLRLLLFTQCNRNCAGCCNKDWDLKNLPVARDFTGYEIIMLTGGEPLLRPFVIVNTVADIRRQTNCPIVVYTAMVNNPNLFAGILSIVDGITLTLHEQKDVEDFKKLCEVLTGDIVKDKSLRLNIFKGIEIDNIPEYWQVKDGIEWIENCPLPQDEEFKRIKL